MGNVVAATAQFTPPGCDLERHREAAGPAGVKTWCHEGTSSLVQQGGQVGVVWDAGQRGSGWGEGHW